MTARATIAAARIMTNTTVARRVVNSEPLVILAIAPFLLFPTPGRLLVLALVPMLCWCARVARGHAVPPTPFNWALWVLLAMVMVSLYATFDVRFSLGKVAGVVLGVLVFWTLSRWIDSMDRLRLATIGFVVAGALLSIVGLLGADGAWFDKYPAIGAINRQIPRMIRGVPGAENGFNPNAVSGALVLFLPVQLALLLGGAPQWRAVTGSASVQHVLTILVGLSLLLTAATLLLMQSRGAWLALLFAGGAFLLWYRPWTRTLAAIAALAGVALALLAGPEFLASFDAARPGPQGNLATRLELWSRALDTIQQSPLTGIGMNTFRKVVPGITMSPFSDMAHAHNNLLQTALDLGLPGLVAYLAIWLMAGWLLIDVYRSCGDRWARRLAGALGAGLLAHFMFGMADAIPLGAKVGVVFWIALGLTSALHRLTAGRGTTVASQVGSR